MFDPNHVQTLTEARSGAAISRAVAADLAIAASITKVLTDARAAIAALPRPTLITGWSQGYDCEDIDGVLADIMPDDAATLAERMTERAHEMQADGYV